MGASLVLLGLTACAVQRLEPDCSAGAAAPLHKVAAPLGHVGQRFAVPFAWTPVQSCGDADVRSVAVEVFDPDNVPVPAEALLPVPTEYGGGLRWETTVVFTPQKLGAHYCIVSFAPEGGLAQGAVWVAADRTGEAPARTARTPDTRCNRLEPLPSGSEVCEQPQRGVVLLRDAVQIAVWPTATYRAAGGALWLSAAPDTLARAAERDGGLEQVERTSGAFHAFTATADEALLWVGDGLERIGFDGAALRFEGKLGPLGGEVLALAHDAASQTAVAATRDRWARFSLAPDAGVAWHVGEGAAHQAPDGLWLEATSGGALRFAPADARLPVVEAPVPAAWQPVRARGALLPGERPLVFPSRFLEAGDAYPSLDRTEVLVPLVRGGAVAWQHFRAPPGTAFTEVSGGWLRASDGDSHHFFRVAP